MAAVSCSRRRAVACGGEGGGRKPIEESSPAVMRLIKAIVEETTAGDPMSLLRWTSKSTRTIAEELARRGHLVHAVTVGRCLSDLGYSLQANRKTKEGPQHAARDEQFRYINRLVKTYIKGVQAAEREALRLIDAIEATAQADTGLKLDFEQEDRRRQCLLHCAGSQVSVAWANTTVNTLRYARLIVKLWNERSTFRRDIAYWDDHKEALAEIDLHFRRGRR